MEAMLPSKIRTATTLVLLALSCSGVGVLTHSSSSAGRAKDVKRAVPVGEKPAPDFRAGSLAKDEPQAVYAADLGDSWNRIFYCLFTRTIQTRLSDDFPEGKPFDRTKVRDLAIGSRLFQRVESGDRAIDPFYPSHFVRYGQAPFERWVDPRYAQLKQALEDALHEGAERLPLARALMQSDVWAAYDRLSAYEVQRREDQQRRNEILALLGRFAKKLALTPQEIKALPDNYTAAAGIDQLPDVFAESSWLEVVWFPDRFHEEFSDHRRVARVFVKPAARPTDKLGFLNGLRNASSIAEKLDSVALVIQNLLIDRNSEVMPTPLTYEVQVRRFLKGRDGKVVGAEVQQFELSRRLFLGKPTSASFEAIERMAPIYLASGGNDLDFASDFHAGVDQPVLVRLNTRCAACHDKNTEAVFTFDLHRGSAPTRPVTLLKPSANEHARYVIERKGERMDFKALQEQWK
jgi:hypothetical protein